MSKSKALEAVLNANKEYVSTFGAKKDLPLPPSRKFAIRSLLISHKLLGTQEWFVIHHSDCGMLTFTNEIMTSLLSESLESAAIGENGWYNPVKEGGSEAAQYINFLPFSNLEKSVVDDVRTIRNHPLVPHNIPIYGYIYDVKTGALVEVPEATEIGKAV